MIEELMKSLMSSKTTQPSINKNKNRVLKSNGLGVYLFEPEHRLLYTNFLPCQAWFGHFLKNIFVNLGLTNFKDNV